MPLQVNSVVLSGGRSFSLTSSLGYPNSTRLRLIVSIKRPAWSFSLSSEVVFLYENRLTLYYNTIIAVCHSHFPTLIFWSSDAICLLLKRFDVQRDDYKQEVVLNFQFDYLFEFHFYDALAHIFPIFYQVLAPLHIGVEAYICCSFRYIRLQHIASGIHFRAFLLRRASCLRTTNKSENSSA